MYRIYPVTQTELVCNDYKVKINGESAPLNSARVSAFPLNRRWPGHQRGIEQTELVNFLSFATDGPVTLEITPRDGFESFTVRPLEAKVNSRREGDRIIVELSGAGYYTVEPYGRNRTLHIFADPMPEYDVDRTSPDVIYFGEGEHDAGIIELKSNQTLFIDEGAVVYATLRACDAENIKILGRGILDNGKNREKILFEVNGDDNKVDVGNAERSHAVTLDYCKGILIDGVTVRDSLVYNICPSGCEDIVIRNVKLIGNWRYNSDGFDMHNCKNVLIENCFLRTYDDCICAKGFCAIGNTEERMNHNGKAYDIFENLLVRNCVLWNDWGKCFEIGAECCAEEMRNIRFTDSAIIHVTATPLDCMNIDYADVHGITYENISVEYDDVIPESKIQRRDSQTYADFECDPDFAPYLICMMVGFHYEYSGGRTRRGRARDLKYKDIRLYGRQDVRIKIVGYDAEHMSEDILIENLTQNGNPVTELKPGNLVTNEFTRNIVIK